MLVKELSVNGYRLKQGNRLFNITSIDNVQYNNEMLKIKAIEVIAYGFKRLR